MESTQFKHLAEIPEHLLGAGKKIVGYNVDNLTAPGENFWSAMLKLDLETVDGNGKKEVTHTVAKCLPAFTKPFQREIALFAMKNEIGFYDEVIPLFKKLRNDYELEDVDFFTKVYIGKVVEETATSRESLLILENLIMEGFKNEDRYVGFDLETSKAILRRLAIFHATFIGLKLQKPEVFEQKVKPYTKRPPPPPKFGTSGGPKDGLDEAPNSPPAMPNLMEIPRFQQAILGDAETAKYLDQLIEIAKIDPFNDRDIVHPEPWSTLIHNDFWVNNIMVKHVEGEECQVKFVDFQMCSYKPFVSDLMFFIFTSVQNHVQLTQYDDLLRHYYDHFTQTLQDLKVEASLTYEQYLDLIQEEGKCEISHSLFFTNVVFGKKGGEADHMNDAEFDHMEHFNEVMKQPLPQEQKEKVLSIVKLAAKLHMLV